MRADELLKRLVELGAENANILHRHGPTVSASFTMIRQNYEATIEPLIPQFAELRGITDLQKGTGQRGVKTGGGLYRYDVIFFLWDNDGNKLEL